MTSDYIRWNLDPEIINVFGFSLRYYGLFFMTGFVLSISLLAQIYKKENLALKNLELLANYSILGILVGARLGHCLFYEPSYYLSHPLEMILPIRFSAEAGVEFIGYQGLASHGGVLGMLIALYFYSRKTKHCLIDTIDLVALVLGLSFGAIRLGNFMNSEIIGIPTAKPWGVIFERVDELPRHAAQLYEAISYFIICSLLMIIYNKFRDRLKNGSLFGLAAILFFTTRILIEFIKENQVEFEDQMLLNMGQILSLPFIVLGLGFLIHGLLKTNKTQNQIN